MFEHKVWLDVERERDTPLSNLIWAITDQDSYEEFQDDVQGKYLCIFVFAVQNFPCVSSFLDFSLIYIAIIPFSI